jgi:hypothetical protein
LFLHPPSFQGFDGGAGARYQARREMRSFWYPTWLAQPAALVPGSRLVGAPPAGLTLPDVVKLAPEYDLAVLHTSAASFAHDVRVAEGGVQASVLGYPHLSRTEIFASVESFYRRFYFRPRKIFGFLREMAKDAALCRRRLAEGAEFVRFLARRHSSA